MSHINIKLFIYTPSAALFASFYGAAPDTYGLSRIHTYTHTNIHSHIHTTSIVYIAIKLYSYTAICIPRFRNFLLDKKLAKLIYLALTGFINLCLLLRNQELF